MMTAEHTEGPWQAKNDHEPYTIIGGIDGPDEGRMHYTEICTVNEEAADAVANARLIAAAPDMLKALKSSLDSADRIGEPGDCERAMVSLRLTQAAIDKAEGTTP